VKRQLTVLQRRVIQQLREAHYEEVATGAQEAWCRAEPHEPAIPIREEQLLADYRKANAQLVTGLIDRRGSVTGTS